jgi:hypothetical protein
LVRQTGRIQGNQTGIGLVLSPSERCPRNSRNDFGQLVNGGQVLPNERQCLAFDQGVDPAVSSDRKSADLAFGITDGGGPDRLNELVFTTGLKARNP